MVCLYFILGSLVGLSLMQSSIASRNSPLIHTHQVLSLGPCSPGSLIARSMLPTEGLFVEAPQDDACAGRAEPGLEGNSCCCR